MEFKDLYKKTFNFLFEEDRKKYLKNLIGQFDDKKDELYNCEKNDNLVQGDVLTEIVFLNIFDQGKAIKKKLKGMIISNSCDIENDENILVAPVYDYSEDVRMQNNDQSYIFNLKKNIICEKFYLPEYKEYSGFVVNFSKATSFNSNYFKSNVKDNSINRVASLSLNGWYFLMNKLALYLFRPESDDVLRTDSLNTTVI